MMVNKKYFSYIIGNYFNFFRSLFGKFVGDVLEILWKLFRNYLAKE